MAVFDAFHQLSTWQSKEVLCKEKLEVTAGLIWNAQNANGELSLAQLKKGVGCLTPVFNWTIGWLARKDEIVIILEGRTFRAGLNGTAAKAAGGN